MNRTINEAIVKRNHYDTHSQLETHVADFIAAYNYARQLKTLKGLTPFEYICKIWTNEPDRFPDRFNVDPTHNMLGLYTECILCFQKRSGAKVRSAWTDVTRYSKGKRRK